MKIPLRIAFVGAGAVNFGGGEGPWDHATRLEAISDLDCVAVVDPDQDAARAQLARRDHRMYRDARIFADVPEMLDSTQPDAVWIGVPPFAHGTSDPGGNVELLCAAAGVHMFIEKPLAAARPNTVRPVKEALVGNDRIVSVGYMFRYSRAVAAMRQTLDGAGVQPRVFLGRYNCAYSEIRKQAWWDSRRSGGTIVEQATHFLDLARYLVAEVNLDTVHAAVIPTGGPLDQLADLPKTSAGAPITEGIPSAYRAPCAVSAQWSFVNGAIGSHTHGVLLHEKAYAAELEIWADGLRMVLSDPYGDCKLQVRYPHSETVEIMSFADDDPYLAEDRAFVDAVRNGDSSRIRSSYEDAFETFRLTWAITEQFL